MCACLADKGRRVIGVDADRAKVDAINRKHAPVFEPGLEELISRSGERLSATQSIEEAVAASDITFIVVATPSEPNGGFSLRYVLPVCEAIGRALRGQRRLPPGRLDQHRLAWRYGQRRTRRARAFQRTPRRPRLRPLLQPGVHRSRHRHPGFPQPGFRPDRRVRHTFGSAAGIALPRSLPTTRRSSPA